MSTLSRLVNLLPEFEKDYFLKVNIGKTYLKNQNIGIVGLCRDNAGTLANVFNFHQELQTLTKNTYLFLYENDSIDSTSQLLINYKLNYSHFDFTSEKFNRKKYSQTRDKDRTEKLAHYRNKCLEYAKINFKDIDYLIVIDCDFLEISIKGICNTFGWLQSNPKINAMCGVSYTFKQKQKLLWNYDSWAFRINWWDDLHNYINHINPMLWFGLWNPLIGSSPIQVNSGFGGCCIYNTKYIQQSYYDGYDCEHVCFHKNLANNHLDFSLYFNPSQIMLLELED